MILRAATLPAIAWLASKVKLPITSEFKGIEAMTDNGDPIGVVVFDKWTFNSVRIHIAVAQPSRELGKVALQYAFGDGENEANKGVVLAEIPASIKGSVRMAEYFGFKQIFIIKDGWKVGDDLIIMELRREDWLKKEGR
jgi:hypothetical protein